MKVNKSKGFIILAVSDLFASSVSGFQIIPSTPGNISQYFDHSIHSEVILF